MISPLAAALAVRLQGIFETVKVQTAPFAESPGGGSLPALAVYPGKLVIQQAARETTPALREVTIHQRVTLGQPKAGPYPLDAPPKLDSLQASLAAPGSPATPLDTASFNVDYPNATISFPTARTKTGSTLMVEFTSVQLSRQREFQQELWIDAYDTSSLEAEKWAGVACSVALNSSAELIAAVNAGSSIRQKTFCMSLMLRQVQLTEAAPLFGSASVGYRLKFLTFGELGLTQMFPESPAVIKEVIIEQKFGTATIR